LRGGKLTEPHSHQSWWYGEDPTDGSTLNYATDSDGNMMHASFVDMTSHSTVQFCQEHHHAEDDHTIELEEDASESRNRKLLAAGPDGLVEGDTVYCTNENTGKIYRYTNGELRHYPQGTFGNDQCKDGR